MSDRQRYNYRLQKITIACKTCDVSESFYSSMSVKRFRLEHVGHEVNEGDAGTPINAPRTEMSDGRQAGEKVKLLKVLVELVTLPTYPAPVFTITGVKDDLKSAFVQVVSPSQRDQVKETLENGKYLDSGSGDTVYVWEPKSISFSEDANLAMSFGDSSYFGSNLAEPASATDAPSRSDAPSTSTDVREIRMAAPDAEQSPLEINEVAHQGEATTFLVPMGPSDSAASPPFGSSDNPATSPPALAQASALGVPPSPGPEPKASAEPSPESKDVSAPARSEGEEAAKPSSEGSQHAKVEEGSYLLVSKSWYIEAGPKNMSEAVRISRILRPFRWTVEPAYTIGVMIDDILSVETASGDIGGDMMKQVEGAGYKLSRVSVERGKPVAWFKKEPASEQVTPES